MNPRELAESVTGYLPESWQWVGGILVFLIIVGLAVKGLSWLIKPISWLVEQSARLKVGQRRRQFSRRRQFVELLQARLERMNREEQWMDREYTELEAEVETEGPRAGDGPLFRLFFSTTGRRRQRSLSKALLESKYRRVVLQGDPGSGKSVALRHAAMIMAESAKSSRRSRIPLYVNLREFRPTGCTVTAADVREYAFNAVLDVSDRRQVSYLDDNFARGLDDGTWFFLFDSFDEIPELLGAVEVDATIHKYENAVAAFLEDAPRCGGVLASREYRGPRDLGWPTFHILSLTDKRRRKFVERAETRPASRQALVTKPAECLGQYPPSGRESTILRFAL